MINLPSSLHVSWRQRLGHSPRGESGHVGENLRGEGDGERERGAHLVSLRCGVEDVDAVIRVAKELERLKRRVARHALCLRAGAALYADLYADLS